MEYTAHNGDRMSSRHDDRFRHKYADPMSEYLDHKVEADEYGGGEDSPYDHMALYGKRIMFTDDRGDVSIDKYPTAQNARNVFDCMNECANTIELLKWDGNSFDHMVLMSNELLAETIRDNS